MLVRPSPRWASSTLSKVKGFLVDPFERTFTPIVTEAIAASIDADLFDVVYVTAEDIAYVDDEGLLKGPTEFFRVEGYPTPLAGKAILTGPSISADWLAQNIDFGVLMKINTDILFIGERTVLPVK